MQELKKQIKNNEIQGIYLFYGEESFILNTYLNIIIEKLMNDSDATMNLDIFESKAINLDKVIESIETLPFLADKRVVVIKELNAFQLKNTDKIDIFIDSLDKIPSTTVLIIVESKVDKRSKLYKKVAKLGNCIEFKKLSEDELIKYIAEQLSKEKIKIQKSVAKYFVHTVGSDLTTVHNELEKLIAFNKGKEFIEKHTIDKVCIKSIENRIFELVDCMGSNKRQVALRLYNDLILLKEPPARILFMITRQFRLILQTKTLSEQKMEHRNIASKLDIPIFVIDKYIKQANKFSNMQIKTALKDCLDIEIQARNGKIDLVLGIELLIVKYS